MEIESEWSTFSHTHTYFHTPIYICLHTHEKISPLITQIFIKAFILIIQLAAWSVLDSKIAFILQYINVYSMSEKKLSKMIC